MSAPTLAQIIDAADRCAAEVALVAWVHHARGIIQDLNEAADASAPLSAELRKAGLRYTLEFDDVAASGMSWLMADLEARICGMGGAASKLHSAGNV